MAMALYPLKTPKESLESFVGEAEGAVRRMFPTIKDNPDYTSIVAQRHYDRIQGHIADARLTCQHCGQQIDARNVTPEPGPAFRNPQPVPDPHSAAKSA